MRYLTNLLLIFLLVGCSPDTSDPNPEPEIEQESEKEEIEEKLEESFTFPFSITVVLKEFSDATNGEFISIDFVHATSEPSVATNLTSFVGLDLNAFIQENGQENVLLFTQGANILEREIISFNLDTRQTNSITNMEIFPDLEDCFGYGNHGASNENSFFTFRFNFCPEGEAVEPIVRNYSSSDNHYFDSLGPSFVGDSQYCVWANNDFLFVHFNDKSNSGNFQDGLIVYDSNSLEIILEDRFEGMMIPLIDDNKMILRRNPNLLDLIDLKSGQTIFSNSVLNSEGLIFGPRIGKTDIHENKVALMIANFDDLRSYPGIYDFQTNSSIVLDSEVYREYFRNSGIPIPNPIRQPKEHIFDLESETFTVLYHGFTQGFIQEDNPDFIGLVYMNFDGEILYEYEFERNQWLEQVVVKR